MNRHTRTMKRAQCQNALCCVRQQTRHKQNRTNASGQLYAKRAATRYLSTPSDALQTQTRTHDTRDTTAPIELRGPRPDADPAAAAVVCDR